MKRTKIICTVGPATAEYEQILELARAGMNVVRLNMSHGGERFYRRVVQHVERIRKKEGISLGLLWDLQGPEIRTGDVQEPYVVQKGEKVCLTSRPAHETDKGVISVSYDQFPESLAVGDEVLIDNGTLRCKVLSIQSTEVRCEILTKGTIRSRMHVNLTGKKLQLPALSQKDLEDLRLGAKLGVDWVALSFVRAAKDLKMLKETLESLKSKAKIMAKIETPEAVDDFASILKQSDGVMVARGDLGSEMSFDLVPNIQDEIVMACREVGKPVVIATHMLESMMTSPMPTRAEATDIAHAVLTQADATMLSGESAIGEYPLESVKAMAKILATTESTVYTEGGIMMPDATGEKGELLLGAASLANRLGVTALLVFSKSGETARMIARNRPNASIHVIVQQKKLAQQLQVFWGVNSHVMTFLKYPESTIKKALGILKKEKSLKKGDKVVVVSDTLMARQQRVASILLMSVE